VYFSAAGASESTAQLPRQRERAEGLVAALDELLALGEGLLAGSELRDLAAARSRLVEQRFNLAVLGEFKRGKSTLVNALLGRELLPTGVVPLTSVVTAIGPGERDRLLVRFADGREQERPLEELPRYVTEALNPGNQLGVELARLELDNELLRAGLELVDTPGIGSVHAHNTEAARAFLPRVDAAILVLDAGQPLTKGERELLREASCQAARVLLVVNKIDHLEPGERELALDFVRSAAGELLGAGGLELFALSARWREGLEPLVARLERLAAVERGGVLSQSAARLARAAARDIAQAARFEARAIELPLDQLAERARTFEQRIGELREAGVEAGELLERGVARALAEHVNEPLASYARVHAARLHAALRARVEELGRCSPRELSAELERFIDATVRAEFAQLEPRFERAIAEQLEALERRYAARVGRLLEQVQETAEDVFGTRAAEILPETGLKAPSRFSFKLRDPEHALDIIVGFGRTVAPGALGRRLVIRDAEQRLLEMTDRHAGRLRSELAERVSGAARAYRRELAGAVEEAIDAIRAAIERAGEERGRGERHARARLERLAAVERRCRELEVELGRGLEGEPGA
jgi:small GTP-binding protein